MNDLQWFHSFRTLTRDQERSHSSNSWSHLPYPSPTPTPMTSKSIFGGGFQQTLGSMLCGDMFEVVEDEGIVGEELDVGSGRGVSMWFVSLMSLLMSCESGRGVSSGEQWFVWSSDCGGLERGNVWFVASPVFLCFEESFSLF